MYQYPFVDGQPARRKIDYSILGTGTRSACFADFKSMSELQFNVSVCAQVALDIIQAGTPWPTYLRADVQEAAVQLQTAFHFEAEAAS